MQNESLAGCPHMLPAALYNGEKRFRVDVPLIPGQFKKNGILSLHEWFRFWVSGINESIF